MEDIILHGDVYACLEQLKDNSIAVAITSPPYWQQRDYGFEDQIGQEETPEEFIGRLIAIFDKLRGKLRDDGLFFLNIGDKYQSQYGKSHLLLIPYRLAYHMVKSGWLLLDIIIWHKSNHMPSSVKDRFVNTYETIFVFAKSKNNRYKKGRGNVFKINLQQTQWKHTAAFPEKLIVEILNKVELKDGDMILDPFAGSGTVALVVKKERTGLMVKKVFSVMIEKNKEFIKIIKKRTGINNIKEFNNVHYKWIPVIEEDIPDVKSLVPLKSKHGEILLAENSGEFLSNLKGITTQKFKDFYREDALFFYGVKDWTLEDFYYFSRVHDLGYVLRNVLTISESNKWYPIFMFAKDSTRFAYKFYLDRIRIKTKFDENKNWEKEDFCGCKVRDITGKKSRDGNIVEIVKKYEDNFPKIVTVQWNGKTSLEYILHSDNDDLIKAGLVFKCPKCKTTLDEPYEMISKNICPSCSKKLWEDIETVPNIEEPKEIIEIIQEVENLSIATSKNINITRYKSQIKKEKTTTSKFEGLKRINWGQSPGARKIMMGEYFSKMRLYRLEHPLVAQHLNILRKFKNLSVKNVTDEFPGSYKHTVGHWFRKDFGGSIPIPKDIKKLKEIFGLKNGILNALERTALKLQTVKASKKGKNPGDFIENLDDTDLILYFKKLFLPPMQYLKLISR